MQIKVTTKYHFTHIRMAIIKKTKQKQKITNVGIACRSVKWCSCYGKQYDNSSKNLNLITKGSSDSTSEYTPKITKGRASKRHLYTEVHSRIMEGTSDICYNMNKP